MQEASLTGFLLTISYIILIYYGLKIIGRYVFPIFFKKIMNNFEQKVKEQQDYQAPADNIKEGETVIDKKPSQNKGSNNDVGEYIDYEEVDE